MLYGFLMELSIKSNNSSLNPYFFGKCSTAGKIELLVKEEGVVLILIFLENALRPSPGDHPPIRWEWS